MNKNKAYYCLSELIFKGFLVSEMCQGENSFVFKTINNKELDMIRLCAGSHKRKNYAIRFNLYYFLFSLLMINGDNLLLRRRENIHDLYDIMLELPYMIFSRFMNKMSELRKDSMESVKYLEGFCYTNKSRNLWRNLGGMPPNDEKVTGFPGTSELGLNVFQKNWILVNNSLDQEEKYNENFSLAILIASSMNQKGSKKVSDDHNNKVRDIKEKRKKIAESGYLDVKKEWKPDGWSAPVDTAEELVAELERQMSGKKDKHDVFIDKYMNNLRKKAEDERKSHEARVRRIKDGTENLDIVSEQRVLSPDEYSKVYSKRNKNVVNTAGESSTTSTDRDKFIKKIGGRLITGRS